MGKTFNGTYRSGWRRGLEIQGATLAAVTCNDKHAVLQVALMRKIPSTSVSFIPAFRVRWGVRNEEIN